MKNGALEESREGVAVKKTDSIIIEVPIYGQDIQCLYVSLKIELRKGRLEL
jgi:hypothetical protein